MESPVRQRESDARAGGRARRARRARSRLVDDERRREEEQVAARAERDAFVHRGVQQRLQRGRRLRPGRDRLARRAVGSPVRRRANRPWPPRTSPITAMARLQALELRYHVRAEPPRALDEAFVAIGVDRGDAGGAGQRVPAVGEARVEHLVARARAAIGARQHDGAERQRCAPVRPLASVIRSGRAGFAVALPGEPFAAAAEAAHHLVGDQRDAALRVSPAQRGPVRVRRARCR